MNLPVPIIGVRAPVVSLVDYHSYRITDAAGNRVVNPAFDANSRAILNIKDPTNKHHRAAVTHFAGLLISRCAVIRAGDGAAFQIAIVPKSEKGQVAPGLKRLAELLCAANPNFVLPRVDILKRIETVNKLANGGMRSMHIHLRTIGFPSTDFSLRAPVLLIDDVTTTGNSLAACTQLLYQVGCPLVVPLVLGRTV
jgi:hypothetical protein